MNKALIFLKKNLRAKLVKILKNPPPNKLIYVKQPKIPKIAKKLR